MSDFLFVFKNLTRNGIRASLCWFAIFIGFFLLATLGPLRDAFEAGVELTADDRLLAVSKISITGRLPVGHVNRIRSLEGVQHATNFNWFGAFYQDQKQQMSAFAVDPESYLKVYPERELRASEAVAWIGTRRGMIAGEELATRYGWKVGDLIPISSSIYTNHSNGSHTWEMELVGIFRGESAQVDTNSMFFHYEYFIDTANYCCDAIGWVALTTVDSSLNGEVAERIDREFSNSGSETETIPEKQFVQANLRQLGDIGLIITSVVSAMFFTILLIVGNTMAVTIQDRTDEIAVLKTIGFPAMRIFKLVLGESMILASMGGLTGLATGYVVIQWANSVAQIQSFLPPMVVSTSTILEVLLGILGLGLLTGLIPAIRAMRLNIVEGFRDL